MNPADTKEHKAGMAMCALITSVVEVAALVESEPLLMQRDAPDIRESYRLLGKVVQLLEKRLAA